MQHLRLTHPAIDFWIDVRLHQYAGRWLAVADLAGTPELGLGRSHSEALHGALAPFGDRLRAELVSRAERAMDP